MNNPTPRTTSMWKGTISIAWKDLRTEFRNVRTVSGMLLFSMLAIVLFSFALELDKTGREASAAGVMWVTLIFAGTLGLGRSLSSEKDQGSLDGLLLSPVDRSALYFGKLIGNFVFMAIVAAILAPLLTILFSVSFFKPLVPVALLMGILGYAGVGTLVASMSIYTQGREIMLPILLLPIALSILIPAVRLTRSLLENIPFNELTAWFNLLLVTNVVYITLAYMFFDFIVEE